MRSTINWREYPKEKPPDNYTDWEIWVIEQADGETKFFVTAEWTGEKWVSINNGNHDLDFITHFALQEDISTVEA